MKRLLLRIDLSNRTHEIEEIPNEIIKKYVGGRGLGAYLLYRFVPPKADPLGEENHLIFTAGPANGTGMYYSSKVNINTKSPLTGIYLYAISSGIVAHTMRQAGFWITTRFSSRMHPPCGVWKPPKPRSVCSRTYLWQRRRQWALGPQGSI
jgi:aldehyde:ferredoxin oxidoreductase